MRRRNYIAKTLAVAVLGITLHSVWNSPTQEAADAESALHVGGEEGRETQLEMSQIAKLPRLSVRAKDEQGKESVWEGTPLHEVLKAAGAKFGAAIPGKALANYVLAEAADGYKVVFAIPELDPVFTDLVFLLAYRRDGQAVDAKEGNSASSRRTKKEMHAGFVNWWRSQFAELSDLPAEKVLVITPGWR